jgi:phage-related tail fiber protein
MLEALNEEKKVNITQFAVGDGGGRFYNPTTAATALKNEVWRGTVNACYISEESENLLIVESVIPSDAGGFTIREMGLFDEDGVLIAICNTPDTQKVRVSDGVVHELDLSMEIALANTESVELIVDPSVVMATKKDVENLRLEVKALIDNINQTTQEQIQEALSIVGNTEKSMDTMKREMLQMAMTMATLTDADIMDSDNVVIETFSSNDDVIMVSGMYDSTNKCLYA